MYTTIHKGSLRFNVFEKKNILFDKNTVKIEIIWNTISI